MSEQRPHVARSARHGRAAATDAQISVALVVVAAVGWWWSARMASHMAVSGEGMSMQAPLSLTAFLLAWVAMTAAMMFPSVAPVVKLYRHASAAGRVAPLPFFLAGYVAAWAAIGLPAYLSWRQLSGPIEAARPWTGRLAGGVLIMAAVWQLTPMKSFCLRHCRSPMSFFMRAGGSLDRPWGALRAGAAHGIHCVGCCWALMAVLVAVGTMNLTWMLILALFIGLEKHNFEKNRLNKSSRAGRSVPVIGAFTLGALGTWLILSPSMFSVVT